MSMCLYVYVPYICIHMNPGVAKSCQGTRVGARASLPGATVYTVQLWKWNSIFTLLYGAFKPQVFTPGCLCGWRFSDLH